MITKTACPERVVPRPGSGRPECVEGSKGGEHTLLYGVSAGWTTKCCSALALIRRVLDTIASQPVNRCAIRAARVVPDPIGLDNRARPPAIVPPAFDAEHLYCRDRRGRVSAYELTRGYCGCGSSRSTEYETRAGNGLVFRRWIRLVTARRATSGEMVWTVPFTETSRPAAWGSGRARSRRQPKDDNLFRASDGQAACVATCPRRLIREWPSCKSRVLPTDNDASSALQADTETPVGTPAGWAGHGPLGTRRAHLRRVHGQFSLLSQRAPTADQMALADGSRRHRVPVADDRTVYFVRSTTCCARFPPQAGVQRGSALSMRADRRTDQGRRHARVPGIAPKLPATTRTTALLQ